MRFQGMWMLFVGLLLVAGVVGCTQEPFPNPAGEESEMTEEAPKSVAEAVSEIEELGGTVLFEGGAVESLDLERTQVTDAKLVHLKGFTELKYLILNDTQITDAGLMHLKGLAELAKLWLKNGKITDAGLVHLKGFTKLKYLSLWGTQITDAGLMHLKGLPELEGLDLRDTQVTDKGVKELQDALPNCRIRR